MDIGLFQGQYDLRAHHCSQMIFSLGKLGLLSQLDLRFVSLVGGRGLTQRRWGLLGCGDFYEQDH